MLERIDPFEPVAIVLRADDAAPPVVLQSASVMTEKLGVSSEMSQEARLDDGPVVFTCRPWNPEVESWNDFKSAVEREYSRYLECSRRKITADETG